MNKSMLVGAVLGAVGVTAGGAVATYSVLNSGPEYAQVLAVQPVTETIKTPRQVCKEVTLTKRRPVKDEHKIAGTLLGAVAGGYAGNTVQGNMQEGDTYTTTETRCSNVTDSSEKVVGYDVKYQLNGLVNQVRMDRDPGAQIPVNKDGQLVLGQAPAQ